MRIFRSSLIIAAKQGTALSALRSVEWMVVTFASQLDYLVKYLTRLED